MQDIIKSLEKLGKEIENSKKTLAQYEGREVELLRRLEGFGVSSVEEAEEKLLLLKEEAVKLEAEITKEFASLKAEYDW
jgi:hypothetical protein